ncbi:hypothetical protein PMAYCL1PPCAC_22667, partial [Pristionchus mayeri]
NYSSSAGAYNKLIEMGLAINRVLRAVPTCSSSNDDFGGVIPCNNYNHSTDGSLISQCSRPLHTVPIS